MYYDLIASLPHLPHFVRAEHSPITSLRLNQRLRRLKPAHAEQLHLAQPLVCWRPQRLLGESDMTLVAAYSALLESPLEPSLRAYAAFRMDQQTLLAAQRRKREGLGPPESADRWGAGQRVHFIRRHWETPDFGLAHLYPWLPQARELLTTGDARGLERLMMEVAWRRLGQCAERNMFGFEAVFSYVFKWEILQNWLACDADRAKARFTELVDKVTHVENN